MTWVSVFNRAERTVETRHVQLVVDKCSRWLKNRPYFSKRGDQRVITGGSPSFYPHDALGLKSTPLPAEIHRIPLTTTAPSKPCFICGSSSWWWREPSPWGSGEWLCCVCHPNSNNHGAVGETFGLITDRPGGGEG